MGVWHRAPDLKSSGVDGRRDLLADRNLTRVAGGVAEGDGESMKAARQVGRED